MSEPDVIFRADSLARNGGLRTGVLQDVRRKLLKGGFVVLPSDTCFSLAILPRDAQIPDLVNRILGRPPGPISLAFSDINHAWPAWVHMTPAAQQVLESFTPGPVTVVCRAADTLPLPFTSGTIDAPNATIGVRIPDSVVERQVSRCTDFPVTTVAIRNVESGEPIRDLAAAMEIVRSGVRALGNIGWLAIDGAGFYGSHSTVVDATSSLPGEAGVRLIREGDVSFADIRATLGYLPKGSFEDWD
jgi:L-threonylcarbamoyladenylate synthase